MTKFQNLTSASQILYIKMIQEAEYENYDNVNGFNLALMDFTKEERGNLADLKKKGLVTTTRDDDVKYLWVEFIDVDTARAVQAVLKG